MKFFRSIPFFILFFFLASSADAQIKLPEIHVNPITFIELNATVNDKNDDLENVQVRFFKKGEPTALVLSDHKGRIKYKLDLNSEYLVVFSKEGYVTKSINFSTYVKDSLLVDIWPNFKFEVELLEGQDSLKTISEPEGRLSFNSDNFRFIPGEFDKSKIKNKEEVEAVLTALVDDFKKKEEIRKQEEQARIEAEKARKEAERLKAESEALAKQMEEERKAEEERKRRQAEAAKQRKEAEERALAEREKLKKELAAKKATAEDIRVLIEEIEYEQALVDEQITGRKKTVEEAYNQASGLSDIDKFNKEIEAIDNEIDLLKKKAYSKKLILAKTDQQKQLTELEQQIELITSQVNEDPASYQKEEYVTQVKKLNDVESENRALYMELMDQVDEKEKELALKQQRVTMEKEEQKELREQQRLARIQKLKEEIAQKQRTEAKIKKEIEVILNNKNILTDEIAQIKSEKENTEQEAAGFQGLSQLNTEAKALEYKVAMLTRKVEWQQADIDHYEKRSDLQLTVSERINLESQIQEEKNAQEEKLLSSEKAANESQNLYQQAREKDSVYENLLTELEKAKQELLVKQTEAQNEEQRLQAEAEKRAKRLSEAQARAEKLKKQAEEQARLEAQRAAEAEKMQTENEKKEKEALEEQLAAADKVVNITEEIIEERKETVVITTVMTKSTDYIYKKISYKKGGTDHFKDDRPITERTYNLELKRRRSEFAELQK